MRYSVLAVLGLVLVSPAAARGENKPPLALSQTISMPGVEGRIDHLAVDLKGKRLFVAALGNNTVEVLDLKKAVRLQSIPGFRQPQGIAYLAESERLVVANGEDGSCRICDGRTFQELQRIDCGEDADNVRHDAAAKRIYVGYGKGALAVIDLQTAARVADIALAGHPESFQLQSGGNRVFVNVPTARQISVVDRRQNAIAAVWPVEDAQANFPMALDEASHRLFVGCRKPARMLVINTDTGKTVASLDCAADTDDLFYDSRLKRIYLSGGEGAIGVFQQSDADCYQLLATIATAPGARTSLFVPQTNCLYLAVPHRDAQQAEVRVYRVSAAPY